MDPKDLKRIVEIMNKNDLVEVEIEEEGKRLRLRKSEGAVVPVAPAAPAAPPPAANPEPAPAPASAPETTAGEGQRVITAPMVGTFYRAPSPEADAYVEVGARVNPESVVCILEAMKVMNEIKADCEGEIVRVCAQNGEAVEYGQPLFVVQTA